MGHKSAKLFALAALALSVTTMQAQAANCQGRRDTGTAVGAIGGGVIGNAATRGSTGGTIAGAVIGGLAGKGVGGGESGELGGGRRIYKKKNKRQRASHARGDKVFF